jgi:hypothetical protein
MVEPIENIFLIQFLMISSYVITIYLCVFLHSMDMANMQIIVGLRIARVKDWGNKKNKARSD